ncbi:autotransporter-associated beta strand repeat-containing protein, partial [Chlamydiales bacterium]|nr:autotransporter-associated beta strand repeat-containing protein [Chlamydiales bacterium]
NPIIMGGAGTIDVVSDTLTWTGTISGAGGILTKEGAGTLKLSSASGNTYSAGTDLNDGIVEVTTDGQFGTGTVTFNTGELAASNTLSYSNILDLMSDGTIDVLTGGSLTWTGTVTNTGKLIKNHFCII